MTDKEKLLEKVKILHVLAMEYEVAVIPLFEEDYLNEFYDFYEIKNRKLKLAPSEGDFNESLKNLSGEYRWESIAGKAKSLFGLPARMMVFDGDTGGLRDKLGGCKGLSPFFFVFDLLFCEYGGFTLCFICGSNN